MKVAFLSTLALDANVSLINSLKKKCDVYFFTEALYEVFNILKKEELKNDITQGVDVSQLAPFKDLLPLEKTFVIKGTRNANIFKKIKNSYKIHNYIKKINPDVIVLDNYMLTYFFSAFVYRKQTLLVVHDPFLHSGETFLIDKILRGMYFRMVNNKMLLNENQKQQFIDYYNYKPNEVFTSFLSVYNYLKYCQKDNLENDKFNVLFFGRISPYKGIKYLLDAFIDIIQNYNYPEISLTIAGSGTFDFDIEAYKKYPQIRIINEYIGSSDLASLISQSSVVVCPYTDATQSGVIMSAFAFYKPVIATNVGGLPEMVENGKTGMIIQPKNSNAIKDAIINLIKNKDVLETMSNNIKNEYIMGDKSWDASADFFVKAFNQIIVKV